jgi:endonuclease/exonuclease/phosphatase family metal-dependent hydrolase
MNRRGSFRGGLVSLAVLIAHYAWAGPQTFRIVTYNVENYLDQPTESRRHPKSAEARAKVRESIRAANPDVLALQEMGALSALQELRSSLKAENLDFPYWEYVCGYDTNIHTAILSKFPIAARRPHTNDTFLLGGRRFWVSRGIAEVDVRVSPGYGFTLITAHLKSKRPVPEADESELRLEEAKVLRNILDKTLAARPDANVVLAGDFNDNKDSVSLKAVMGRGRFKLLDVRPAERNGDSEPAGRLDRNITWTHYYGKEDSYSRIDYILLSPGMAREWIPGESFVLSIPNWGIGSDHRPVAATFQAVER